jgi:hypothetical protein
MADTGVSGATTEVTVDNEALATADNRKKIIKYVIIALVLVGAYFLVRKYILKK